MKKTAKTPGDLEITPKPTNIYEEIGIERARAHVKHLHSSAEHLDVTDAKRLAVLMEEVGEVAKEFNEARENGRPIDLKALRKELIQVASTASTWADNFPKDTAKT